ncbi:MAG: hypothetical protein Q7J25_09970 [Vicinamibacterales bacterium]|nr:hypothetical protein [Vicinamibacterales bacterium]
MTRTCSVLLLSLAFAGAPVFGDYCAVSCEAAHMGGASASSAHAGHHHASAAALSSIAQPPQPCGHAYNGIVGVAVSSDNAKVRPLTPQSPAVMPASPLAPSLSMLAHDVHGSNSPPDTTLRGFASPIRV